MATQISSIGSSRACFYAKADIPVSDELLRSLGTGDMLPFARQAAATYTRCFSIQPTIVLPLARQGTWHRLFRVSSETGPTVIARVAMLDRVEHEQSHYLDRWASEQLSAAGLPAVRVLAIDPACELGSHACQLLEPAPGRPLADGDHEEQQTIRLLGDLGRLLARLHTIRTEGFGLLDAAPLAAGSTSAPRGGWNSWLEYLQTNFDEHLDRCRELGAIDWRQAQRIANAFAAGTSQLGPMTPVLLHGDLGSHNIFTDGQTITALVDWEDCLAGDAVYDLAFWATFHPRRRYRALLAAYREAAEPAADFDQRFWLYYLRVALAKTVLRHRFDLRDRPGSPPASDRIHRALEALEDCLEGGREATSPRLPAKRPKAKADICELQALGRRIRLDVLRMVHRSGASHVGSCLSVTDLLAVLYGSVLDVDPARPDWPARDRLVMSKGHAAAAVYAVLAERGFFPTEWLDTYCENGSRLAGHVSHHGVPGVEVSSGALGHGLSIACGMALAGQREGRPYRVFALLSDGELDEGSIWEAVLFAPHHRLENLTAIVDFNKLQSFGPVKEVLDLEPLADKFRAFGWSVCQVDGHDYPQLLACLGRLPARAGKPTVVIANTVKGRGVSFMEHQLKWHYRSPSAEEFAAACREIEAAR